MPGHLILAFERGYNALPGAMIQDVTTWGVFKQVVRELKKPEVKETYKSLIIDTVDFAADACQTSKWSRISANLFHCTEICGDCS